MTTSPAPGPNRTTGRLAVEPEPYLRRLAQAAARQAPVPAEVSDGLAEQIPVPDASPDAAVFTFALCTIQSPGTALREVFRALKPGGQVRFLEHARAGTPGLARRQHLLDATIWPTLFGGCHLSRDTATAIQHAGFTIERLGQFLFPPAPTPLSFHIRGSARRP